jgi:hypothetical protein
MSLNYANLPFANGLTPENLPMQRFISAVVEMLRNPRGKAPLDMLNEQDCCRTEPMDNGKYRFSCTLTFGDIYGQIIVWLVILIISLAASLALMGARQPIFALATVGLILVLSLPFLLFAFVTTLLNHIEFEMVEDGAAQSATKQQPIPAQTPVQAAS